MASTPASASNSTPIALLSFADRTGRVHARLFTRPTRVLIAERLDHVRPVLRAVQAATQAGQYAVGYVSYEAAPAFDPALVVYPDHHMPLAWFGLFDAPQHDHHRATGTVDLPPLPWQPRTRRARYDRDIATIRSAIADGITYQLNYTLRLQAAFDGDPLALFRQLHAAQPAPYSAYLDLGRFCVLSLSPELFFDRRDGEIVTRPMKGTAPRGRWVAEDEERRAWLAASTKNRAENLMIVDLLRNDLGRIAQVGSVDVADLFAIERYPTVFQMTSTVTARERPHTTLEDIFAALFPCGSITGVPKVRTMQLIRDLEPSPREIYCGAIGIVEPGGNATFSVAIRTAWIDSQTAIATYGVGGGITWDSSAADEYAEAIAKAAVLRERLPPFELLETLRLKRGRYALLDGHLDRIVASARYFDIPLDRAKTRSALLQIAQSHAADRETQYRVRLRVDREGVIAIEITPHAPLPHDPQTVALARTPINREDRSLFHKTTHRAVYDQHRQHAPDVFDVLLWNEADELCEFTIGNLVLRLDGRLWTPPRSSGLLAGVFRNALLQRGTIAERVLRRDDLLRASEVWLINSVRGWVRVTLRDRDRQRLRSS